MPRKNELAGRVAKEKIMLARLRWPQRLLAAIFCTSLAITLMGAGLLSTAPVLVLFPFRYAEGLDPRYSTDYITKLGASMTAAGGVRIVIGDPATTPENFLHTAKVDGGDFYLNGFIAPPVNGAMAVIEQIVSARSGTVVWANTAHISSDKDIADQGPIVQNALLTYATRGYFAILNPTPKPAATPTTSAKKNGIVGAGSAPDSSRGVPKAPLDLPNEAYGFSSKPTAPPKVYASANHPTRFVVLPITGKTVPVVIRTYAESSLVGALSRHGQTAAQGDPEQTQHPLLRGAQICAQTGGKYLVWGDVRTNSNDATDGDDMWTEAYMNVAVYDCASQRLQSVAKPLHSSAFSWKTAVDHAANLAVTDYLLKVSTVAHF
jgi:hypothetical protein